MLRSFLFIFVFSFLFAGNTQAQLGLSFARLHPAASDWDAGFPVGNSPEVQAWWQSSGYKVGLDYWFRLKEVRVEFFPELSYALYPTELPSYKGGLAMFQWHTNIYPMDFWDDCDCPTFSKQDPWFQRGFFFQVSPGIGALHQQYQSDNQQDALSWNLVYSLGAGAGFDFGISDWVTISPYARWNYFIGAEYTNWSETPPFEVVPPSVRPESDASQLHQWEYGLRLGVRWK